MQEKTRKKYFQNETWSKTKHGNTKSKPKQENQTQQKSIVHDSNNLSLVKIGSLKNLTKRKKRVENKGVAVKIQQ